MLVGSGCRSSGESAAVDAPPRKRVVVTKKRGFGTGAFERVAIGDTMEAVRAAAGEPTHTRGHLMGKNFNPFYWGSDRYHWIWYYADKGRVTFNIKKRVMVIENDPSEDGAK